MRRIALVAAAVLAAALVSGCAPSADAEPVPTNEVNLPD